LHTKQRFRHRSPDLRRDRSLDHHKSLTLDPRGQAVRSHMLYRAMPSHCETFAPPDNRDLRCRNTLERIASDATDD
jgi:DNA-binding sugar fermentation-stimulating protein